MSFSNLDFLYQHLPAHMRRDDVDLFLRRFLGVPCGELDDWELTFDTFHQMIAPETATEEFINWWLWALFGWGWFPAWATLAQKRVFYKDIAIHYARRGTARGIKEFLAAFGIRSRVIAAPQFYGEYTTDADGWVIETPLVVVIQIFPETAGLPEQLAFYGEWTTDEWAVFEPKLVPTRADVDALLRFQQPAGHIFIIEEKIATAPEEA